jgi:REP element-mobilizing transposase RayT
LKPRLNGLTATTSAYADWVSDDGKRSKAVRRTQIGIVIHLVWGTWDRLPLLSPEIESVVYRAISAKCADLGVQVVASGGVADHVHLLVRLPATLSIADLVKETRGASSHLVTHGHLLAPGQVFKWQGAYAAFSVSPRQVLQVRDYIARQKEHHMAGSLTSDWEIPPENGSSSLTAADG